MGRPVLPRVSTDVTPAGMKAAPRTVALGVIVVAVVMGTAVFGFRAAFAQRATRDASPDVALRSLAEVQAVPHIVFRSTASDATYGFVTRVPLADPNGARRHRPRLRTRRRHH